MQPSLSVALSVSLQPMQRRIAPRLLHQLVVGAILDNAAALDGDYAGNSYSGGDYYAGGDSYDGGSDYAPVVLDIAGKGVNITQLSSSSTYFDVTGDGYKNLTAWAGVGNGVLFVDTTGAGQLTQANQIVFTNWDPGAKSDMQALLDVFDTNHDGALDAGDANFSKFFVMVTNADGTQTAQSLAALGITSINLNACPRPLRWHSVFASVHDRAPEKNSRQIT